jgi:two-component system chemotaxis sensor kinase CheA
MQPTASNNTDLQQSFLQSAPASLASVRSVLLIAAQTGDPTNLIAAVRTIARLGFEAAVVGLEETAELCRQCESKLKLLSSLDHCPAHRSFEVLDMVARIDAALWNFPLESQELLPDVSEFVDASFHELAPAGDGQIDLVDQIEEFEIDEETMEIFRSEATDLMANIARALESLTQTPGDQNAIWDLRRHAHTLKGAAGIVGLRTASETAHQMEDVLSLLAERKLAAAPVACAFLSASARQLDEIVNAEGSAGDAQDHHEQYQAVMKWLSSPDPSQGDQAEAVLGSTSTQQIKPTTTPIVRVSLERLDEIIELSKVLAANWSSASDRLGGIARQGLPNSAADLSTLLSRQQSLTEELHASLLQIRMVRFGTLKTRLSRAVHGTCLDEKKRAVVEIENGEVEIDTLVIDAIIEPLLHLVKNAVVHGIEAPDTRRFIGKDETGLIRIRIEANSENLMLSVSDDGAGISIGRLKEKAIEAGIIDAGSAVLMDDLAAIDLIFDRGLTTAAKIDLNAGRGVGMSIVKESVEARGGTVLVETAPQQGSTFTILMPLGCPTTELTPTEIASVESSTTSEAPLVMVVDDSASMRHITSKLVKGAGYRVTAAADGAEAVDMLLTGQCEPDLILSDVEMSQIDGWELLRFVKTNINLGNIPVVLVTSLDAEQHRRKAFELGAFDYIVKPFKSEHLEAILRNLPNLATA